MVTKKEAKKLLFRRTDIKSLGGKTSSYHLSQDVVDFMNLLEEEHGVVEGVEFERCEDGKFGLNIGFFLR